MPYRPSTPLETSELVMHHTLTNLLMDGGRSLCRPGTAEARPSSSFFSRENHY